MNHLASYKKDSDFLQSNAQNTFWEGLRGAESFVRASRAAHTQKGYSADWRAFSNWCANESLTALPASPESLTAYISLRAVAGASVSTIRRVIASVNYVHRTSGNTPLPTEHPAFQATWDGIRRTKGVAQKGKAALMTSDIERLVEAAKQRHSKANASELLALRDRALLITGFAGAFRRSELAAIRLEHVSFTSDGVNILVPRSKTDQEGKGQTKALPFGSNPNLCPVRTLKQWIEASQIESGHLFRGITKGGQLRGTAITGHGIAKIIKACATVAGLDATKYAPHSLRVGFVTQADANGARRSKIKEMTGHKSDVMVDRYTRSNDLYRDNAAAKLGL